jgi:two-component system OmpR family response regulator
LRQDDAGEAAAGNGGDVRILVVEDDLMIGKSLQDSLRDRSYAVDWVTDGASADLVLHDDSYEILLLDIGLPQRSGFEILADLRRRRQRLPVLIITALDGVEDRVRGLDLGADDYLVKPFDLDELMARMRALARRRNGDGQPVLSNGEISLEPATHTVTVGKTSHVLPTREFALLLALMERPGTILSRAQLEEKLYGWNDEVESNAVDVLIHYLRRKLGPKAIRNVRGAGWMVPRHA